MIQNDAELIQRTLEGDQDAFGSLVKKYQKGIHALAWRKIGDFDTPTPKVVGFLLPHS